MKNELKRIVKNLISFETTSGNHDAIDACFKYLESELSWYPFRVKRYSRNQNQSMVWSTSRGVSSQIILNAHLDVVPGKPTQFKLKERGGNWYGRGVMDMKFSIAVFIVALKKLYKDTGKLPSLAVIITSDEETGGASGVGYLVNKIGYKSDIVLIPDGGSNWHIVQNAKGVLHLSVTTSGIPCHGSRPWEGNSAIDDLLTKLAQLRGRYPKYSKPTPATTLVIGTIAGGQQTNQVAGHAQATLDFRYPAKVSPATILKQVKGIFGEDNVNILVYADPFSVDPHIPLIKRWQNLIAPHQKGKLYVNEYGASDGRYFSAKAIPVIVSQPVGGNIHSNEEFIDIASVVKYTEIVINWLTAIK